MKGVIMKAYAITTVDNPFNPLKEEEWNDWFSYDVKHGYNTCERLASITTLSDALTEEENNETIHNSMLELCKFGAISKDGKQIEYKILEANV
jgi:hypothetical protein